MKAKIFKAGFPFLAFFVAIFGAFAFQTNTSGSATMDHFGAIPVPGGCEEISKVCTDQQTTTKCRSGVQQLYRLNGTACGAELWEKIN